MSQFLLIIKGHGYKTFQKLCSNKHSNIISARTVMELRRCEPKDYCSTEASGPDIICKTCNEDFCNGEVTKDMQRSSVVGNFSVSMGLKVLLACLMVISI